MIEIAAKLAGMLGIRAIGRASDKGDLQKLSKSRGGLIIGFEKA